MTSPLFETIRLDRAHDRSGFSCGESALDEYLRVRAGQDARCGAAGVFVAVAPGSNDVLGFYTLSASSVELVELPSELRKKLPRYGHVPALLLGRLAVHERMQGQKLGGYLLVDALRRSLNIDAGWVLLMVQAKHNRAASFYRHFGFRPLGNDPLTLYISKKTASEVCCKHN